jgi:hypothetical protein
METDSNRLFSCFHRSVVGTVIRIIRKEKLYIIFTQYRGLSILRYPLIKKIWVFRKSISIYFLALARIYLFW